jgi:hypothetical protein
VSDTAIVSAVAAFVALIASSIAYGQWQTAQWKLAADLYPIRHAAYLKIMDAFEFWYRQGPMTPERLDKFENAFLSARFLFGRDLRDKFDEVREEITKLANIEYMINQCEAAREKGLDLDECSEQENELRWDKVQEITSYLYEFYVDDDLFAPFLSLEYRIPSRRIFRVEQRKPSSDSDNLEA